MVPLSARVHVREREREQEQACRTMLTRVIPCRRSREVTHEQKPECKEGTRKLTALAEEHSRLREWQAERLWKEQSMRSACKRQ